MAVLAKWHLLSNAHTLVWIATWVKKQKAISTGIETDIQYPHPHRWRKREHLTGNGFQKRHKAGNKTGQTPTAPHF